MKAVLDTCVLLWLTLDPERLSGEVVSQYASAEERLVCSISVWEIGIKCKKGRIELGASFEDYRNKLSNCPDFSIVSVDAEMWASSVSLSWDHRDPADRLIVALAQKHDATILTSDVRIMRYYERCVG